MRQLFRSVSAILVLATTSVLMSCSGANEHQEHNHGNEDHSGHDHAEHEHGDVHGDEHEHSVFEESVVLQESAKGLIGVDTETLRDVQVSRTIPVFGETELLPQAQYDVTSVFNANISSIHVIEGQFVKKGQLLFELSHPEISEVKQDITAMRATISFLEQELQRAKQLHADNYTSLEDVQSKETDLTVAQARLRTLLAKCELAGFSPDESWNGRTLQVRAPSEGNVRKVHIMMGDFVESGASLVTLVNAKTELHADFQVFQKYALDVAVGQTIVFSAEGYEDVYTAEIFAVSAELEDGTRSRHIHAHVHDENGRKLIPGMKLHGYIVVDSEDQLAVPDEAVIEMENQQAVFLDHGNGLYRPVKIQTGHSSGGFTHIVNPDSTLRTARIVVTGAWEMMSELTNSGVGCAH